MFENRGYDDTKWRVYFQNGGYREFRDEKEARDWFNVAFKPGTNAGLYLQVDRCDFVETLTAGNQE